MEKKQNHLFPHSKQFCSITSESKVIVLFLDAINGKFLFLNLKYDRRDGPSPVS